MGGFAITRRFVKGSGLGIEVGIPPQPPRKVLCSQIVTQTVLAQMIQVELCVALESKAPSVLAGRKGHVAPFGRYLGIPSPRHLSHQLIDTVENI